MKDKIHLEWENIGPDTWRLRVFKGWIVRYAMSNQMCFIPDNLHAWEMV